MDKIDFKVIGKIVGKQRPRATSYGGRAHIYTPKETMDYESLVKFSFLEKYPNDVNTELSQTYESYEDYYTSYKHFAEWLVIEKNLEFDTEEEEKDWINKYKDTYSLVDVQNSLSSLVVSYQDITDDSIDEQLKRKTLKIKEN